jgi:2-polyprenyl-6-methoxyphenol hydroxylase-like FAD-dependent oxidoreductase
MTAVRTALVIGGGIAGPVTALALRKAGIDATVYESYATTADGIGGTLSVAPNGLDALQIIGADKAVTSIGLPMTHTVLTDGDGRLIGEFGGLQGLQPSRALWRPDLYRAIHDYATAQGVSIEYGKRLVSVTETATAVTAHFADGTSATGDLLVGADGIHSTVRALIDPDAPGPDNVPLLNFGGLADLAVPADPEAMYFVFGRGGFLGYWSQPDGRTAWFSNLPHAEPMTATEARAVPVTEWLSRLRDVYSQDQRGSELLARTSPDQLVVLGSVEIMPSLPHWSRNRMVLVGDSAHAPSPSSGQGVSLAAEGAIQLARCLRDLPDLATALSTYENLCRARVEKVAARAKRTNNSKGMGPMAVSMMRLMMPLMTKTFLTPEKMLGLEQRHTIDWDSPVSVPA